MIDAEFAEFMNNQTEDVIMQRMLSNLPDDIDKSEGSYIWDSLMPVAIEEAKIFAYGGEILNRGFIRTTYGKYLDLKADETPISRNDASFTVELLKFKGEENTIIPKGARVSTPSDNVNAPVEFETLKQVTVGKNGEAKVEAQALEAGSIGNISPGNISIIVSDLEGIKSVTNIEITGIGYDEESDEDLLQRILEYNQEDPGPGNVDDYVAWAKEMTGVGNVRVDPLWNGPNTVKVIILDQNGNVADGELLKKVQKHLDPNENGDGSGEAPVGAIVTVDTASIIKVEATVPGVVAESGYTMEQTKANIEEQLRKYLNSANPGGVIRIREASAEIINAPGVLDVKDILLDGKRQNIELSSVELADLGSVHYP